MTLFFVLFFVLFCFVLFLLGKGSLAGAQKHGALSRRSKRKNWKPAYFVLRDKIIYIFKTEDDAANTSPEELEEEQLLKKKGIIKVGGRERRNIIVGNVSIKY